MGKYHEAIELFAAFETRLAGSPRQPAARLGHGWALMKLGKPAEAGKVFEQIVGDEKLGIEARYWLGLSQKAQKDWPGAAETLLAAAAADPSHRLVSAMRFHAGDARILAGQAAAARREFDQVLAAGGEDEWVEGALHGKIAIALLEKDHVAIDRDAAEFSRRFPHSDLKIDVQRIVVRSLIERKQYQQATAILRELSRGPRIVRSAGNVGPATIGRPLPLDPRLRGAQTLRRRPRNTRTGAVVGDRILEGRRTADQSLAAHGEEGVSRGPGGLGNMAIHDLARN